MRRRSFAAAVTIATVALCVAVIGVAATAAEPEQPSPVKQYKIAWRLVRTAPDGQCEVLMAPNVITDEGTSACFCDGSEIPPPQKAHLREKLHQGTTCEVTVQRTEQGQLLLNAKVEIATLAAPNPQKDSVRLATIGVRVVEAITLGKTTIVPLGAGDEKSTKQHLELVVTEVNARETPVSAIHLRLSEGVVDWRAHPIE